MLSCFVQVTGRPLRSYARVRSMPRWPEAAGCISPFLSAVLCCAGDREAAQELAGRGKGKEHVRQQFVCHPFLGPSCVVQETGKRSRTWQARVRSMPCWPKVHVACHSFSVPTRRAGDRDAAQELAGKGKEQAQLARSSRLYLILLSAVL